MNRHQLPARRLLFVSTVVLNAIFIVLLNGFVLPPVLAQIEHTKDNKDQTLRSNARVNPSTLAMEFSLPITGLNGRAGNSLALSLEYSSKVWTSDGMTFFNGAGTRTNVTAKFAERSSAGWNSTLDVPRLNLITTGGGWDSGSEVELYKTDGSAWKESNDGSQPPTNFPLVYISRMRVTMPSGATVELRRDDFETHPHGDAFDPRVPRSDVYQGVYLSTDGSKMRLELSWVSDELRSVLYLPDGSRYFDLPVNGAIARDTVLIDRHGNRMTYNSGTRLWTDTLGRSIENPLISDLYSEPTAGTKTLSYPGIGTQTRNYQLVWEKLDTQHSALAYQSPAYCLGTYIYPVPTGYTYLFGTNGQTTRFCGSNAPFNPVVLTEVRLPDNTAYKFKYNLYGEIEKIEYPTGGYERFEYDYLPPISSAAGLAYDQLNRGVVKRWLSYDGISEDTPWQYAVTKQTTPTQNFPYLVKTVAPDGTWTEQRLTDRYSKASAPFGFDDQTVGRSIEDRAYTSTNQLLKRHLTKWTQTGPLTVGGIAGHYRASRDLRPEKEITVTFEPGEANALVQLSETIYETPGQNGAPTDPAYFAALNARQTKTYHYISIPAANAESYTIDQLAAQFTSANLATITEIDYLYHANYKDRNITGLVTETRIKDASGTVKAKSHIDYDEANYDLTSTGTLPTAAANSWLNPQTELGTTLGSKRGLPTTVKSYSDLAVNANLYIETHSFYDQYGNVRKTRDGRGNDAQMQYDAAFAFAYPTKTITPPNSPNVSFETTVDYNYNTGLVISSKDANNLETRMEYNDALLRPTKVQQYFGGLPVGAATETIYGAGTAASTRYVKTRAQIDTQNWKEAYAWFDGLGRPTKSQSVDAASGDVFALTCYDTKGRLSKVSNPFRNVANATCASSLEWTTTTYDTVTGRAWKTTTPDTAVVETNYALATSGTHLGTIVTVKDQALKERRSITNALGQLVRVDEPTDTGGLGAINAPNQPTYYDYDTLSNLVTVKQGGSLSSPEQTRTFVYDSLSRLKSATNPESGTITYGYDENGNLTSKVDARSITTNYAYDALNRVTARTYNDSVTLPVSYTYDTSSIANAKGKLTKVTTGTSPNVFSTTEYQSFDKLGRVTQSQQTTDGMAIDPMTYAYNLSGAMVEQTYPSGRVVKNVLDNEGDLALVQSKRNGNYGFWNYAKSFTYTAAGAVSSMQLGNGRWESTVFNSRLQPTQIALGTIQNGTDKLKLSFTYNTANSNDNNGNVLSQTITVPTETRSSTTYAGFTATQNYSYDSLNRLKSATETIPSQTGWKQTFKYDRYGNRNFDYGTNPSAPDTTTPNAQSTTPKVVNPEVLTTNNRFKQDQDNDSIPDYLYDASGNTTRDANNRKFTYDAENKQTKVETVNSSGTVTGTLGTYFYDGDGKRVKKVSATETVIFIYDASGKLVAEYANQTATTPQVSYLTSDHLGSPRINTDQNGQVISRHDYQPFGEELYAISGNTARTGYSTDEVRKQFTSYERDNESGLDFAQARYYGNSLGRFTSPDPLYIEFRRLPFPQAWNLYAYTRNNPLTFIDPDGLEVAVNCKTTKEQTKACQEQTTTDLNNRKDGQFKVEIKNGKLAIVGKVDASKLSKSERKLYNAITDSFGKATLNVEMSSDKITFGRADAAGQNSVDLSDLSKLNASGNKTLSGEVIAHEAIEGYESSLDFMDEEDAGLPYQQTGQFRRSHATANQFFGDVSITLADVSGLSGARVSSRDATYNFGRLGTSVTVTKKFKTPVPLASITSFENAVGDIDKVVAPNAPAQTPVKPK